MTATTRSPRAIRDYVEATVLPALGVAGRGFAVEPPAGPGTRSSLWLIRIDGMPPLLLRSHAHRRQAAASAAAMRHMETLNLPAPRLVFSDIPLSAWLRPAGRPRRVTIETFIDGVAHARLADPAAVAPAALKVAELLARMHAVVRAEWGRPDRPGSGSFVAGALAVARRMIRDLGRSGWLDTAARDLTERSLQAGRERVAAIRSFSLVHNDLNRHNVVVTAEGEVALVDLHRIAYEPFGEEVLNALYHFTRKDPALAAMFERTYFARAGDAMRRTFDETRGFFEPLHWLKKMHRRAAVLARDRGAADDPRMTRYLRGLTSAASSPG